MVYKRDLPDPTPYGVLLRCPSCCQEFSASRGDYWNLDEAQTLRCSECPEDGDDNGKGQGEPLELVRRVVAYETWRLPVSRTFYESSNVGTAKYCVHIHDGIKMHADGSPFYDLRIFKDKRVKDAVVKRLIARGYVRR